MVNGVLGSVGIGEYLLSVFCVVCCVVCGVVWCVMFCVVVLFLPPSCPSVTVITNPGVGVSGNTDGVGGDVLTLVRSGGTKVLPGGHGGMGVYFLFLLISLGTQSLWERGSPNLPNPGGAMFRPGRRQGSLYFFGVGGGWGEGQLSGVGGLEGGKSGDMDPTGGPSVTQLLPNDSQLSMESTLRILQGGDSPADDVGGVGCG